MDEKQKKTELSTPEKTGAFIKLLRTSHNLTQEELGDIIYVTRKAVSKWENGICYPSIDLIPSIADLFGVSLEEILAGEFKCDDTDPNTFDYVIRVFKNKHIKVIIRSIIVIVVFCLLTFFFENYNATKLYNIYYEDDEINVKNGIIISTRSKQYLNIGSIWIDNKKSDNIFPINCKLIYKDKNKNEELVTFSIKNNYYYGNMDYKKITDYKIDELIDRLYLQINYLEDNITIEKEVKLNVNLKYKSNEIVQFKEDNYDRLLPRYKLEVFTLNQNINSPFIIPSSAINVDKIYNMSQNSKAYYHGKYGLDIYDTNNGLLITDGKNRLEIDFDGKSYCLKENKKIFEPIKCEKILDNKIVINSITSINETSKFLNTLSYIFN